MARLSRGVLNGVHVILTQHFVETDPAIQRFDVVFISACKSPLWGLSDEPVNEKYLGLSNILQQYDDHKRRAEAGPTSRSLNLPHPT